MSIVSGASGPYDWGMRMLVLIFVLLGMAEANAAVPDLALLNKRLSAGAPARVLFIGNSYSFRVPKAFEKLVQAEGRRLVVEQVTKGGWTLARHAKAGETLGKIREGDWDVVVLQEQSQTPALSRERRERTMIPATRELVAEIRKAGAVPAMFVTWGRRDGDKQNAKVFPGDTMEAMQGRLNTGYREAAAAAGGALLVPVGPAWLKAKQAGRLEGLFSRDGSHPAEDGVYLSACVFYRTFYGTGIRKAAGGREKALAALAEAM